MGWALTSISGSGFEAQRQYDVLVDCAAIVIRTQSGHVSVRYAGAKTSAHARIVLRKKCLILLGKSANCGGVIISPC